MRSPQGLWTRGLQGTEIEAPFEKRHTEAFLLQRIILLDSDMIVLKNMDDLMDTDLRGHSIGSVNVCACNPRGFQHYPRDW